MLQINPEIYFKSINEKHALTFLNSTLLHVLYFEQEKHLRRYCIASMSDAMCDAIAYILLHLYFYQ